VSVFIRGNQYKDVIKRVRLSANKRERFCESDQKDFRIYFGPTLKLVVPHFRVSGTI
jgi:hypothetical protein